MPLSTEILISEVDRLIARAERQVQRDRDVKDAGEVPQRAALQLKRLQLYRAILKCNKSAHALMPEYIVARGLVAPEQGKSEA